MHKKLGQLPLLIVYIVPCKMRNKFLVNFWDRTILLCIPCISSLRFSVCSLLIFMEKRKGSPKRFVSGLVITQSKHILLYSCHVIQIGHISFTVRRANS
jgi:hypothetical protein